ncbi:MAG TPA: alpha/beta hydrolase [Chryseolinea sp.]
MKNSKLFITAFLALLFLASCEPELSIHEPGNLVPKTAEDDSSVPSININGAKLHSEAFGHPDDPLIVVLHGGPGGDYRSLLNCKEFALHGYRVVFYDQRGAGLSERFPYSSYTMQVLYDDLAAVIAHYQTSPSQPVFLLGHSWGAMLASAYINEYPAAPISGLILGEPGGLKWADVEDYLSRSLDFRLLGEGLNDAVYHDQILTGRKNDHAILDYKFDLRIAADEGADSPTGNEGRLPHWRSGAVTSHAYLDFAERENPDWTTNLSQYTTKVLFIYSENNEAYGLSHAQKVSAAYPNVQLFETLDAGHDMLSFPRGWKNTFPTMLNYLNSLK